METLAQDIRFALRMLGKNPGFTLVAVLVLAIGIGANTAIFSVVDTVLLRPLPYPRSESLVLVENTYKEIGNTPISYPQYQFWREQSQIFDQVITFNYGAAALTGMRFLGTGWTGVGSLCCAGAARDARGPAGGAQERINRPTGPCDRAVLNPS